MGIVASLVIREAQVVKREASESGPIYASPFDGLTVPNNAIP